MNFPDPDLKLPIHEVDEKNLGKIIEYLKHYKTEKSTDIPKLLPGSNLIQQVLDHGIMIIFQSYLSKNVLN